MKILQKLSLNYHQISSDTHLISSANNLSPLKFPYKSEISGSENRPLRPEFFYFSLYRSSRPNFLEIEKQIRDFFQFYFFISLRLMPVQYWSSVMFFRFVFSTSARLIYSPGEILSF